MKIHVFTRIRNEAHIMGPSLDKWAEFADHAYVYDDDSTDGTYEVIVDHPLVLRSLIGLDRAINRDVANFRDRQRALELVKTSGKLSPGDWLVYLDADEHPTLTREMLESLPDSVVGVKMRLFDAYITPDDVGKGWQSRKWFGPEYRDILIAFRYTEHVRYHKPGQRPATIGPGKVISRGYVKHYGKAISVDEWEQTCKYYAYGDFPTQTTMNRKWKARMGKAVKRDYLSDFKFPLIRWHSRDEKGFLLTTSIHEREFI